MMSKERFSHFLPLVLFTALMIVAAGWIMAVTAFHFITSSWEERPFHLGGLFLLTVVGVLASFLHLGRKKRAYRALHGFTHSWLSREVVFAGLLVSLVGISLLLDIMVGPTWGFSLLLCVASAVALVLMITVGMVYQLHQQLTWRSPADALSPFTSALYLAACALLFKTGDSNVEFCFFVLWIFDLILCGKRYTAYLRTKIHGIGLLFPSLKVWVWWGYALRFSASIGVLFAILIQKGESALVLIILSIVMDRLCFYAGSVRLTPASETARLKLDRMKAAAGGSDAPRG